MIFLKKSIVILLIFVVFISVFVTSVIAATTPQKVDVTYISLSSTNVGLSVGDTYDIMLYVYPSNATNVKCTVTSTNDNIATATIIQKEKTVRVSAIGEGSATIKVISSSNKDIMASVVIDVSDVKEDLSPDDVESAIDNAIDSKSGEGDKTSWIEKIESTFLGFVNACFGFDLMEEAIGNSEQHFGYIKVDYIIAFLKRIFLPLAYAILLISWCLGMGKKGISLDLMEGKELIRAAGKLIIGMMFITAGVEIFTLIHIMDKAIISKILTEGNYVIDQADFMFTTSLFENSDVWIIGPIISFFTFLSKLPSFLIMAVMNLLISLIIEITLCFRLIKICIYTGVSPVFMGLLASDDTAAIGKNYIIQYVRICAQGIVIAIMFWIFKMAFMNSNEVINGVVENPISMWGSMTYMVTMIILPIMILNSGKLVDKMIGS